jgi:ubiquinone/menaquinone biosynthesis C-methylase UbiE
MLNDNIVTDEKAIEEKLIKNWTEGSSSYSAIVKKELNSFKRKAWTDLIRENIGKGTTLDVLDVGTGPGFFAILLAQEGHRVSAIDCTQSMIDEARKNAESEGVNVCFNVSDAQDLKFPDESFDIIISRNVTWTLIDAERAYTEWKRVLRPGGRVIIFDANWNLRLFDENLMREYEKSVEDYKHNFGEEVPGYTKEMLDYRRSMPMCRRIRPQWDCDALISAGYKKIICDTSIWERVFDERERVKYRTNPMFMIVAEK